MERMYRTLIAILIAATTARGAVEERRSFEYDRLFPRTLSGATPMAAPVAPEIAPAMESPIDPATYHMVPGDLLELEVGGETDRAWRLAVSAEGTLLLPSAVSVSAAGSLLADVEGAVRTALAAQYPKGPIGLHLLQPGAFRVPVTGAVATPGILAARGFERASTILAAAGGPLPGGSLRRIEIRSAGGPAREIDLILFALRGRMEENPTLGPGMSIHVPPARQFVRVTGAVRGLAGMERPIVPNVGSRIPESPRLTLEWKEGDTAGFLIDRAGGFSDDATGDLWLTREGKRDLYHFAAVESMALKPDDLIEASVRDRWVYVVGAVRYPGPYGHIPSLSALDYVRLAGGPTELGRGNGWRIYYVDHDDSQPVEEDSFVPPGSTVVVPERWTYRVSTLLAPISGVTALVISVIALRR